MRVIRLAAAIALTTGGGAPIGATAVRLSGAMAISAAGAGAAGGSEEKPPLGVSALASAAQKNTAATAASATLRPRAGRVGFTVFRTPAIAFQSASEVS
jgi:hypothetical protein